MRRTHITTLVAAGLGLTLLACSPGVTAPTGSADHGLPTDCEVQPAVDDRRDCQPIG